MHADDTNYTLVKNGVVVVSGTGPAIRVDGRRLVLRDGPQGTPPLVLTRAEASKRLRHVVVCGHAGGFVTFDALRWLRDTGVAFTQLDWDGSLITASGPRGPDRPALRRTQALVCSGVIPKAAVAITREILRAKLSGQAAVAALMGSADASTKISKLAAESRTRRTEASCCRWKLTLPSYTGRCGETCLSDLHAATHSALGPMADGALAGLNCGSHLARAPRY